MKSARRAFSGHQTSLGSHGLLSASYFLQWKNLNIISPELVCGEHISFQGVYGWCVCVCVCSVRVCRSWCWDVCACIGVGVCVCEVVTLSGLGWGSPLTDPSSASVCHT